MSATSVRVATSGDCLQSKGRYGSCGWQVKLCDPLAIGPYLSALEMRFMTKCYTSGRSLLYYFLCWNDAGLEMKMADLTVILQTDRETDTQTDLKLLDCAVS